MQRKSFTALLTALLLLLLLYCPAYALGELDPGDKPGGDEGNIDFDDLNPWDNPFCDVQADDWFYPSVKDCCQNHLFDGVAAGFFAPQGTMTRAMVAQVIWRQAGAPAPTDENPFQDVDKDSWYGSAVLWAYQNGIVNGVSSYQFAPNKAMRRIDLALLLYRRACAIGAVDPAAYADATEWQAFPDADAVPAYAQSAARWAVRSGVLQGSDGFLLPNVFVNRAQAATVFSRMEAMREAANET